MKLIATDWIKEKILSIHDVEFFEAEQAWENRQPPYLIDEREQHRSNPPTVWFISPTDFPFRQPRLLRLTVIQHPAEGIAVLRTTWEATDEDIKLYEENF